MVWTLNGICRKAVRATLVLLPLFGTHFVVTIYRPPSIPGSCEWIEIYYYVDYILDGLQGFLVALIFCYVNGEVGNRRNFSSSYTSIVLFSEGHHPHPHVHMVT